MEAIAIEIQRRRKELRLTQAELAALADISERTLRDIEKASTSPSVGAVLATCEALGLSLRAVAPGLGD